MAIEKSCKERANETLLQALEAHAFGLRHERITKKDAEVMAILAGAITGPAPDFAGLMAALTTQGRHQPEETDQEAIRAKEEYEKQQLERRREWEARLERKQERFRAAQAAKTPEELEAEEKLWRERFRAPGSDQTSG